MADVLEPRQVEFLKYYLDPKSNTFSNALQSALKAGYSQEYAESITHQMPDWLAENLGREKMVKKAEKNLDEAMESTDEKIKVDVSKFVVSRLHKEKWSERQELTGADGKDLKIELVQYANNTDTSKLPATSLPVAVITGDRQGGEESSNGLA